MLRPLSLNRAFSLETLFQLQGRRYFGQVKSSRPRIDPFKPPRHQRTQQQYQQRQSFSSSHQKTQSLSQRLRKLSREYGWSALGIYLLLSAIDFPFCFMAVRFLGADRIGHYEDVILQTVADGIRAIWPGKQTRWSKSEKEKAADDEERGKMDAGRTDEQGVKKVDEASMFFFKLSKKCNSVANNIVLGIWTQVALAYAIHKSLIFIRVPLTAAITPKVVKVLRAWGVDITKRRP